jgi:hypothetical protein
LPAFNIATLVFHKLLRHSLDQFLCITGYL